MMEFGIHGDQRVKPAVRVSDRETPEVPIDHVHLERYTLGNRALELEVLGLFSGQAPITFGELKAALCQKSHRVAAHTLKGSARAVGAWKVARLAQEAEHKVMDDADLPDLLIALQQAISEVDCYIKELPPA